MFEFVGVKYKEILDIPKLMIAKDKITSFMGPSGGGKTTILKILNKMLSPTAGYILYKEHKLDEIDSIHHRRQVTMLSQTPAIFEGDVKYNLTAGLFFQNKRMPTDDELRAMLLRINLDKPLSSAAHTLSGGEKQRLALGRVLLLDAEVYLLDEPSAALDEATARSVIEMITAYARDEKKTLVMVTHSPAIARRFSDEVIQVCDGQCTGGLQ